MMTDHHTETITCPKCGLAQDAVVEHTVPFNSYAHECACGYWITESEWERQTALKNQRAANWIDK